MLRPAMGRPERTQGVGARVLAGIPVSRIEAWASRVRAARVGPGVEGLAAGQGLAIYVRPLPPDLGSSEGLLLSSGLHVRHDPDPAVVARRAYVLLASHLLRDTQPTERDVWTLAARLAPEKERGNSLVLRRMRQK